MVVVQSHQPVAVIWFVCAVIIAHADVGEAAKTVIGDGSRHSRSLIINGQKAEKGRYPYFVTLDHFCGGALIAPDIVLAAGHCKTTTTGGKFHREKHHAHIGTYSFKHDKRNVDYDDKRIIQQVRHPSFKWVGDDEFIHDFLLLKLRDSSSKPYIQLNRHPHLPTANQTVVAMGVGNTDPDYESKSDILMQVELNAITNHECEQSADPERNMTYKGRIYPSMMCTTGGEHNERDACAYDSGSPIIIQGATPANDTLVALVSWGEECADPQFPGVNARVSDAFDWIRASVCAMSDDPPDELCAPSIMGTNVNTVDDSWHTYVWHALTILLGVTAILLVVERIWSSRRQHYGLPPAVGKKCNIIPGFSSTVSPQSSVSSSDELEGLNGGGHASSCLTHVKKVSYDSTGIEVI